MEIEGWMISLGAAVTTFIATFAVMKVKISDNEKKVVGMGISLDKVKEMVSEVKMMSANNLSLSEAADKYISKEYFKQFEKHLDEKFKNTDAKLEGINITLNKLLTHIITEKK